ncbi:MAG TPA: transglycosylase domain-containing protein, partial [Roseiarcus sp.]|nr:transglycosylase domain-containing protein [Roseiarcus sp.]
MRNERRWFAALGLAIFFAGLALPGAWFSYVQSLGPIDLASQRDGSTIVVDRDGRLLRAFTMPDGRWRLPVRSGDVDPRYLAMLLAYEDHRFYDHGGVDWRAMARALFQMATRGRIVSGGSTLTMQVARLIEPRQQRSLAAKLRQVARALDIESLVSKQGIIDRYLALAPFGGNIEGVRAASLAYFGKEPRRLSIAEAALLVALPQSPEARRPDRSPDAARAARNRVIDRAVERGVISKAEGEAAKSEPVPREKKPFPMLAAHAAEEAAAADPRAHVLRLSIDARLQEKLEMLARDSAERLGPKISVAIVAVDNKSGEIRARVGAADYMSIERGGAIDMTRAPRSPGSALKPLIYA